MIISRLIQLGLGLKLDLEKDIRGLNALLTYQDWHTGPRSKLCSIILLTDTSLDLPLKCFNSWTQLLTRTLQASLMSNSFIGLKACCFCIQDSFFQSACPKKANRYSIFLLEPLSGARGNRVELEIYMDNGDPFLCRCTQSYRSPMWWRPTSQPAWTTGAGGTKNSARATLWSRSSVSVSVLETSLRASQEVGSLVFKFKFLLTHSEISTCSEPVGYTNLLWDFLFWTFMAFCVFAGH